MDFAVPQRMQDLAGRAREFIRRRVVPFERRLLSEPFSRIEPELLALRPEVRALGLLAAHMPASAGGAGLSLLEFAFIGEALGTSPLGHFVFNCHAPDAGNMELLLHFGSTEQHERWLKPLVRGEIRGCFAMTEPARAGSNPTWIEATARRDGGDYVIDGHKWFTTGAEGAAFAIVMAVTNDAAAPHERASQIIVPAGTPGYCFVRNIPVMGEAGDRWAGHAEVRFENCRVPVANRIGDEGAGFALAQERLGPGRIHHCVRWLGICERAFELMCRRAVTRELKPGEPLAFRQLTQTAVAESRAEIDAARLLVLHAAWRIDHEGQKAARHDISKIKFFVADVLSRVLDRALQLHGAAGLVDDVSPLAFWYRHERAAHIYDGVDEVHKTALAKSILRRAAANLEPEK